MTRGRVASLSATEGDGSALATPRGVTAIRKCASCRAVLRIPRPEDEHRHTGGVAIPSQRADAADVALQGGGRRPPRAADGRPGPEAATEPASASDGDVVRRILAGDQNGFSELIRRHGDRLYRHAERMTRRPDDAADLVQAAFIRAYERLGRCDPERVGGWLFRILANLCRDYLKDPRRAQLSLVDAAPLAASAKTGPEAALERSEWHRTLSDALARLTVEQREAFLLKHYDGYSYAELSELLGVPEAAIKMRVYRAREALRALLESEP